MNIHTRSLITALIIFCIASLTVSTVHASPSPQADGVPNPAAEAYLLEALRTNGFASLDVLPEGERNISGFALVNALKDPQVQSHSFIYIGNLTVVDGLFANDLVLPANIQFASVNFADIVDFNSSRLQAITLTDSNFRGSTNFSFATFDGNVIIQNNTFQDSLDFSFATFNGNVIALNNIFEGLFFGRSRINGSVDLRDNTINLGINFYGTHVTGELLLDGSQILGTEPLPGTSYPSEFWTTTVDGLASFANVHFAGPAYFAQSDFYRLDMGGVIFDQDVDFTSTTVNRSAFFANAQFGQRADFTDFYVDNTANFNGASFAGDAVFENGTFQRDVSFLDASFNGSANFNYVSVGRFSDFIGTTFNGDFSFFYATVAWPYFESVTFNGPVTFEGMQAEEDFELSNTSYNFTEAPFPVTLVNVDGAVSFINFSAPAGLKLSRSHFESLSIESEQKLQTAFLDISETDISNELTITNLDTSEFIAEGASVGTSTNLSQVGITKRLDLRNASIGFLKIDDQPKWPTDPSAFNLRGMTYTDIDIGDQGLTEETFQALLGLVNQSAYSPQAYQSLSQFLMDKGHSDWAAQVELQQSRRERNEILTPLSGAWFWSWFLDIFAGYGHQPAFAFIWSGLVVAVGALVFRRREDMTPVEQDNAKVEYNPVWYSFALFIPYIDLGIANKWEPSMERKWARYYKYVHMMLGWILAPIALLTFSGIIG